jgi:iron complex transport system substrate-binding protein
MVKKTHIIAVAAVVAVVLIAAIVVVVKPNLSGTTEQQPETIQIVDTLGRTVTVPTEINRIVGVNPGCLRLLTYMNAYDMVCGIEEFETNVDGKPYAMAHPDYATLPIIGPQFGGDPELIAAQTPDVVFTTDTVSTNIDSLQEQLGIPVVGLVYGGLDTQEETQQFYDALTLIGKILHKEDRATEVINYVSGLISDLDSRTSSIPDAEKPSVYIGGLSSRGLHGFTSTNGYYAPFTLTNSKNVVTDEMVQGSSAVVNIDAEVIPSLNPDVIFVDYNGLSLCKEDIQNHMDVYGTLTAIQNNYTYGLLGYALYSINYDIVLSNSYYVGTVLYPDQFSDINPSAKADEIYAFLVGEPLYDEMAELYGPFGAVNLH